MLAIRFADRVGKGIRTSPRDALIAEMVPPEKRGQAFGLQRAMDNAGALFGPLLAALLLKFVFDDVRSVFLLAAIPGLLAVALLVFGVRENPRPRPVESAPVSFRGALPRRFWIAIGIFVLFTLASSTDAFLLLKASDSGIPVWQLPLLWALLQRRQGGGRSARRRAGGPARARLDDRGGLGRLRARLRGLRLRGHRSPDLGTLRLLRASSTR